MDKQAEKVIEDYTQRATGIFDVVQGMKLELSENDDAYDLRYISIALTRCTTIMEKISDGQLILMKMDIELRKFWHRARVLVRAKERELKMGEAYRALPRDLKPDWMQKSMGPLVEDAEAWNALFEMLGQVKEAVGERMQLMKRLDSDIRLHQKLYETKIAAGMVPKPGLHGDLAPMVSL